MFAMDAVDVGNIVTAEFALVTKELVQRWIIDEWMFILPDLHTFSPEGKQHHGIFRFLKDCGYLVRIWHSVWCFAILPLCSSSFAHSILGFFSGKCRHFTTMTMLGCTLPKEAPRRPFHKRNSLYWHCSDSWRWMAYQSLVASLKFLEILGLQECENKFTFRQLRWKGAKSPNSIFFSEVIVFGRWGVYSSFVPHFFRCLLKFLCKMFTSRV